MKTQKAAKSHKTELSPEEARKQERLAYAKRRIEILDERLGKDVGAKRERKRLNAIIEKGGAL